MSTGLLTIDLGAVQQNYQILQDRVGDSCQVGAVVKANSYGLGAEKIVPVLYAKGCRTFFVVSPQEAVPLRQLFDDIEIYTLYGFFPDQADLYLEHNIIPVLDNLEKIALYRDFAKAHTRKMPAALHFNTGMNRLGLSKTQAHKIIEDQALLDGLDIRYIMSHLACADEPDHALNRIQLEQFLKYSSHFPHAKLCFSNSFGVFLGPDYHFDAVRPGMALYGLNPTPYKDNPMQSVVTLALPVLRRHTLKKGAFVGYGATYQAQEDLPLATLAGGYADGIFRWLSSKAVFYWKNYPCPVRGRVSMDLTTIDLSHVPEAERPAMGEYVEVIGPNQRADDIAETANTIGYEILTALGQRYKRRYINNPQD